MATLVAAINSGPAKSGADQFNAAVASMTASADRFARSSSGIDTAVAGASRVLVTLAAVIGSAGIGRSVVAASDSFTLMKSRLDVLSTSGFGAEVVLNQLNEAAARSRAPVDQLSSVYLRNAQSLASMGRSQADGIRLAETLSKVTTVSGASAQEAAAGMQQLGQAIASGRLQGDEFRSISENLPAVLRILTSELGVTEKQLRAMATAGQLSGELLVNALLNASGKVDADFAKIAANSGSAFSQLTSQLSFVVGKVSESAGVSREWAAVWQDLTQKLNSPAFQAGARGIADGLVSAAKATAYLVATVEEAVPAIRAFFSVLGETDAVKTLGQAIYGVADGIGTFARLTAQDLGLVKGEASKTAAQVETLEAGTQQSFFARVAARRAAFEQEMDARKKWAATVDIAVAAPGKLPVKLQESEASKLAREQSLQNEILRARAAGDDARAARLAGELEVQKKVTTELKEADAAGASRLAGAIRETAELKLQSEYRRTNDTTSEQISILSQQAAITRAEATGQKDLANELRENLAVRQAVTKEIREASGALAGELEAQVRATEAARRQKEVMDANRAAGAEMAQTLTSGFLEGARNGEKFTNTLRNITANLIEVIAKAALLKPLEGAFSNSFSSFLGGSSVAAPGEGIASLFGSVASSFAGFGFANGGMFDSPVAIRANGARATMGESGPEAIMPLQRGPDGRLGVAASGGGQSVVVNITVAGDATDATVEKLRQVARSEIARATPQIVGSSVDAVRDTNLSDPQYLRR